MTPKTDAVQHNTELITRHFRYEESGQHDEVLEEMIDLPEYFLPGVSPDLLVGREQVHAIHVQLFDAFKPLKITIENLFVTETSGCAQLLIGGINTNELIPGVPPSGKELFYHVCSVFEIAGGKVKRESVYLDSGEIIRQSGSDEAE